MADWTIYFGTLLVALLGTTRFLGVRRWNATAAVRHGAAFALAQAASMLVSAPASVALINHLIPLPSSADLCADLLRMTASRSLLLLAEHLPWAGPPANAGTRRAGTTTIRRLLNSRAPLWIATALFVSVSATWRAGLEVIPGAGNRLLQALYDTLILGYSDYCLLILATALTACLRDLAPGPVRQGVRLLRLSAWLGVVWASWGVDDIITVMRNGIQAGGLDLVSGILSIACMSAALAGASVKLWATPQHTLREWAADYRHYQALGPLWRSLHHQLPDIALSTPPAWRAWIPPRDARFALYRRIIEIHDAHLALPHLDTPPAPPSKAPHRTTGAAHRSTLHEEADRLLRSPLWPPSPTPPARPRIPPQTGTPGPHSAS